MRRVIAVIGAIFIVCLMADGPAGIRLHSQATFRTRTDLVAVGVSVSDTKGSLVTNLSVEDFEVFEDGVRQSVQVFSRGVGAGGEIPLHLGLLFDKSLSLERDLALERTAVTRFLARVPGVEDTTLVEFDTDVRLTRFRGNDTAGLATRLQQATASGWTAFYDAVAVYFDGADQTDGRTILIMYTDGEDTRSQTTLTRLLNQLRASSITVYAVGLLNQVGPARERLQARIRQMTELTGGLAFFPPTADDLDAVYNRLLEELKAQYFLGYSSPNPKQDGTWRRIEVRVKGAGMRTRARPGYLAAARASRR